MALPDEIRRSPTIIVPSWRTPMAKTAPQKSNTRKRLKFASMADDLTRRSWQNCFRSWEIETALANQTLLRVEISPATSDGTLLSKSHVRAVGQHAIAITVPLPPDPNTRCQHSNPADCFHYCGDLSVVR